MAYTTQNSAKTTSPDSPNSALAGIVAAGLDIALVTAVVAAEDALARLDERAARRAPCATVLTPARIFTTPAQTSGSPANSSISKTSFSTTPKWIFARPPTN